MAITRDLRVGRAACAAGLVGVIAACGTAAASSEVHRGQGVDVPAGKLSAGDVAAAQTAFGLDLLHEVCARVPGENVLLSPTSAAEALGLLYPASGGRTAEDVGGVLHLPAWSPDLVAAVREHTRALTGLRYDGDLDDEDAADALNLSNRIWTASALEPEQRYLDDVATAFGADVQALDFAGDPAGATERINRTVDEDTNGLIEKLYDEALSPDTVVALTNALHLRARWAVPFSGSADEQFEAPSGEVTVDMMSGAPGVARTSDGWQSVELAYRDGTMAAVAILPPEDTEPCTVDGTVLTALAGEQPADVEVRLPRLHIEQTHQLLEPLAALGLPTGGDYSGLGQVGAEISAVVQKTVLQVDERGTEAAAATGLTMTTSAPAPKPVVAFDRPFLFLLTDTATRSPLFVTVVHDPTA